MCGDQNNGVEEKQSGSEMMCTVHIYIYICGTHKYTYIYIKWYKFYNVWDPMR